MSKQLVPWDYLIVTASNDAQAKAYESQLALRRRLGFLSGVREVLVVPDPLGRRVGSGGSTICCLMEVVNRELGAWRSRTAPMEAVEAVLRRTRVLIIHAGGDSRRLPAYGPCGKIFIPVPGESDTALGLSLFDRVAPAFLALPPGAPGAGQVVMASGDALILFDPSNVSLEAPGMTALACPATPAHAGKHGVFCAGRYGDVSLYLQKPDIAAQKQLGAINRYGQSLLDIGVMSFDASMAMALLDAFGIRPARDGKLAWAPAMEKEVLLRGVDFYREVCCAMGTAATAAHHRRQARSAGSTWDDAGLKKMFDALSRVPFALQTVGQARFLHFGTTRQLITSGQELRQSDLGATPPGAPLSLNNEIADGGEIAGADAWVEGCRISARLELGGRNVVIGLEVARDLVLPAGACIDVLRGRARGGKPAWFIRCYGLNDTFKDTLAAGATFCNMPLSEWLSAIGAGATDIWPAEVPPDQRSLWNARVFPAEAKHEAYRKWLWIFAPGSAGAEQKRAFLGADRYSAAEIAVLADQEDFFARRDRVRAGSVRPELPRLFRLGSEFSADELAWVLERSADPAGVVADLLAEAKLHDGASATAGLESFGYCRIIHSLGSAVRQLARSAQMPLEKVLPKMDARLDPGLRAWLRTIALPFVAGQPARQWAQSAHESAFAHLNQTILRSSFGNVDQPRNAMRRDETVWGRAPARLELGGGWTDTPPYTLEYGGEVANTAINLNGQPPIHCYGRVIDEPVIRLFSIDTGLHAEIRELPELMDYRNPRDPFGLVKAALAISGFSPEMASSLQGMSLREILQEFGGGIELTTLVGIPRGSGLGTSSIIGATVVAVLHRIIGRPLTQRKLFHEVLRLEQALTTGGGWQDQIGGMVGGTKITVTQPGLFPDPRVHFVPNDVLDPQLNGGSTLLYYTGLTRLAKNILQQIVAGYLDRDRTIMACLADEHRVARCQVDALARKDAAEFGYYLDVAWGLQQRLCRDVTNKPINRLLERIRPHIFGARILGAGSGGFMLMICKSPKDAARIREDLEAEPLNECARFFGFEINHAGLEVTAC